VAGGRVAWLFRLLWQILSRAGVGAGVQISSRRGDGGVAEGSLDQMNGRTPIESVGGVGVAEPVGGDLLLLQSGFLRRGVDDAADLGHVERSPAVAARKGWVYGLGVPLNRQELDPDLAPHVGGGEKGGHFGGRNGTSGTVTLWTLVRLRGG
jgi:hypothetical protein